MDVTLQVVGALAIVGTLTVIGLKIRTLLQLGRRVGELSIEIGMVKVEVEDDVLPRIEALEGKREFAHGGEIDGLARKVNALANHGRTLELAGAKIKRLEDRITRLETEIPPKGATQVPDPAQSAADRPTDAGIGGEDPTAPARG